MSGLAIYRASRTQLSRLLNEGAVVSGFLRCQPGVTNFDSNPLALETLRSQAPTGLTSLLHARPFRVSSMAMLSLQVQVPPLGESITDGTIAAILKQPGDAVEEDEPILQIETDKVTIDVRSPKAGTVEAILVKEDENVTVGHVVASITEGAAAGRAEGAPPKDISSPPPAEAAAPTEPAPSPPAVASTSAPASGRQATINFPPRRTATGDIISLMPAAQAAAAKEAALPKPLRMTEAPKVPNFFIRLPPKPTGPPPPPRKEISDWEIEQIMLGGAGP